MRLIEIKWNRNLNNGDISISVRAKNFFPTCFSSFTRHFPPTFIQLLSLLLSSSSSFSQTWKRVVRSVVFIHSNGKAFSLPLIFHLVFFLFSFYHSLFWCHLSYYFYTLFIDHSRISIQSNSKLCVNFYYDE